MDRGRKPPQVAPVGTKKKMPVATAAKDHELPTSSGLYGEMMDPSKDGNASKALRSDGLTFDPSLLVGPLYVPKTSTNERIKAQLGDITQKLHDTLYTFEETELEVTVEDPLVTMMKKQMDSIADSNVRHALATVMDQYNHMSEQVNAAYRDRDEWFTLDHLDLAEIKLSVDETEEANIKQSYFDTVTNFEKLKNLQQQINKNSKSGKPTKKLQAKKVEIENSVVDKFRVMKDMSIQTMKLKVADDAPWKDPAKEMVGMLKNVRSESADEMLAISKKMQNLFDQLDKQAFTIRSLSAELREKKEIAQKLTAENNDMAQDLAALHYRQSKYENDLSNAQQMIRQLHGQLLKEETHVKGVEPPQAPETLKQSISKLLAKIEEPETPVKKMTSDPAMLRTQIRTYQEAMDGLREKTSKGPLYATHHTSSTLSISSNRLSQRIFQLLSERRLKFRTLSTRHTRTSSFQISISRSLNPSLSTMPTGPTCSGPMPRPGSSLATGTRIFSRSGTTTLNQSTGPTRSDTSSYTSMGVCTRTWILSAYVRWIG